MNADSSLSPSRRSIISGAHILIVLVWSGLVTGLIEGVLMWLVQAADWMTWRASMSAVAPDLIWVSALVDVALFGGMGLVLCVLARWWRWWSEFRTVVFVAAFLMMADWLGISDRLETYAVLFLAAGIASVVAGALAAHEATFVRMVRRTLPGLVAATLVAFGGVVGARAVAESVAERRLGTAAPTTPNILFIVLDTVRADHLSSYGYARPTSPNIDRLGREGVLFEQAFATSSWTLPSHASMLTGRYLFEHRVEWYSRFNAEHPTLAEEMRAMGYRTGAFSANLAVFNRRWGFDRGFTRFEDYFHSPMDAFLRTMAGRYVRYYAVTPDRALNAGRKRAPLVNAAALEWIKLDPARPFFVVLNYFDAHTPYPPPEPFTRRFRERKVDPNHPRFRGIDFKAMPPSRLQRTVDEYDSALAYVDHHVGQLVESIKERPGGRDVLIVITADHGEGLGEHGMLGHRKSLYRPEIHVPLIAWSPSRIPAGLRVSRPVSLTAIPATLIDLLGTARANPFPGQSLRRLWENPMESISWPCPLAEVAQADFGGLRTPVYEGSIRSLVSTQWHYIAHSTSGEELYDWRQDPPELVNLASTEAGRAVVERFRAYLAAMTAGRTEACPGALIEHEARPVEQEAGTSPGQ